MKQKKTKNLFAKSITLLLLVVIVYGIYKCSSGDSQPPRSAEEIRLDDSRRIDTTALQSVVRLDSIEGWERLNGLSAEAWILVEDSSGLLISEKNADERLFPASLTKMMTGLLALEDGRLSDSIEITKELCITRDARVRPGDAYLAGNLIKEMLLLSDNDAAYALASHIGGDTLFFCEMMNRKAAYLGMDSTHFANPNGMPNDSNYSTARDLLTLARYSMRDSLFADIVGSAFLDLPLLDGRHLPSKNTNVMLESYEGCIGVKTGFTRQAGACLASAATRNGVRLFLVLLKSRSHASRFTESAILLDYGFRVMEEYRQRTGK
jgi:D-alanyl-D-alanine carboxypeptidase/D-alanyl-D-alanine carboxypeptidase (penicillin-binding protein 5/6)